MTLETLSLLLIKASLFALVAAIGMVSTWREATSLLRSPGLLVRSVLSMQVLLPIIAFLLATRLPLHPGVKIAIVLLSLSPVPPALPGKEIKAGGSHAFAVSLLVVSAVLAIAVIPASLRILSDVTTLTLGIAPMAIAKLVATSILVPLAVGLLISTVRLELGRRLAPLVTKIGVVCLVLGIIPPIVAMLPAMRMLIGDGTLAVCAVLCLAALLIGHLLGGPVPGDRTVLALSTSMRHPAMAIALAKANFAHEPLVVPAILLYLLVAVVVRLPYLKLGVRRRAEYVAPGEATMVRR
jgi:bile acid:Na+ symporter, BASS family